MSGLPRKRPSATASIHVVMGQSRLIAVRQTERRLAAGMTRNWISATVSSSAK